MFRNAPNVNDNIYLAFDGSSDLTGVNPSFTLNYILLDTDIEKYGSSIADVGGLSAFSL